MIIASMITANEINANMIINNVIVTNMMLAGVTGELRSIILKLGLDTKLTP